MTDAEALSLPPREAIRFLGGKVAVPTRRWDDVWKAAHSRAFMVAGVQAEDVLAGVRGALDKALREGTTLAEFQRGLNPLMQRLGWDAKGVGAARHGRDDYVAWRTRLVYETNLRGAYAAGQYEQQTDPDVLALVPVWRYRHSGALDPRPEHVRWDGLTLRHDDPWWRTHYPPNGWGCGCWVEPLTEDQAARGAGARGRDAQGLNEAPEILRRRWTDPASGRTDMVPLGIDPGWDYNVGAAWRDLRDLPAPAVPIPEDWPPAPPALPPRSQPLAMRTEVRRAAVGPAVLRQDQVLRTEQAAWRAGLSAEAVQDIARYRSRLGQALNRELRGERPPSPGLADLTNRLRGALARAVLASDLVVQRGVSPEEAAALGAVGEEGAFRAFVSATLAPDIAADFGRRRNGQVVELRLQAGLAGAAYLQGIGGEAPRQYELLLAPGLRYRVVSRSKRRIVLEVLRA